MHPRLLAHSAGLLLLVFSACSPIGGAPDSAKRRRAEQDPCAGAPKVIMSTDLLKKDQQAQLAWVGYGIAKVAALEGKIAGVSAKRASDYAIELKAHEMLLKLWKAHRHESSKPDPYLEMLLEIENAGLLEEYVLAVFGEPGWTVPPSVFPSFDWPQFQRWAEKHPRFKPERLAAACSAKARLDAPSLPTSFPDPELLSPATHSCAQVEPGLAEAAARWQRVQPTLDGRALALAPKSSPMPALGWAFSHVADFPNGLRLVPISISMLLYYQGFCAIEANDFTLAESALRMGAELAPYDARIRLELAHVFVQQKNLPEAMAEIEAGLTYAQGKCQTALAWRKKGFVLFEEGKLADAYRAYQKSLDFDPASKVAVDEMLLLARNMSKSGGMPSDLKAFQPPPSTTLRTDCHEH